MSKSLEDLEKSVASIGPQTTCDQAPTAVKKTCNACLKKDNSKEIIECVAQTVFDYLHSVKD